MSNHLFTAWHPVQAPAATPDPLAAIEQAIECLASGRPVPELAAGLLHAALLRFMAGSRFEQAMGAFWYQVAAGELLSDVGEARE